MHINFDPHSPAEDLISFEDFLKVDIRIGEVVEVEDFPEARNPSFKLRIDFGEGVGIKKTSAQLKGHYCENSLQGKRVAAVVNFPPRQIGKFMSEVLVLGFSDENEDVVLFDPDHSLPKGSRLH